MNAIKKRFLALTLLVISCIFFMNIGIEVHADEEIEKYEMKITTGIDGKFRSSKHIPVTVEFTSLEKDFNGEVEIRVDANDNAQYDAYAKEVSAKQGETIKVIIPIKISDGMSKINVNLIENNKILFTKNSLISSGRISDSNILMGVLSDDLSSLSYIDKVLFSENDFSGIIEKVEITPEMIGENNLNIDTLDIILINNFNLANFKEEEYDSLNTWINNGGTLIIGSGENYSKTIGNINKDFLNIEIKSNKEANVNINGENLNLLLSNIDIQKSKIKIKSGDNALLYSVKSGKGEILVSTFDLGLEPFSSSKAASSFIKEALKNTYASLYNNYINGNYYGNYYGSDITKTLPINEIVSEEALIIVLLIYALVVGILVYVVLKKLNKRDLNWVVVPVTAIIFTLIIYFMGNKSRLNDIILNQNNIVYMDESGKGEVKGYLGIGTKYKDTLVINKPELVDMTYLSEDYYYGNNENNTNRTLRVKTTYSGDESYFAFDSLAALDLKSFEVKGKQEVLSKIDSSFNIINGKLQGKVKNNFDYDIENLILVCGNNVFELGTLNKGEEKEIKDISNVGIAGIQGYADTMNQKYYEARWQSGFDKKDPKYKNILRKASLVRALAQEYPMSNTSNLIAITNIPIDYEINFDNKSLSKFDTTIVVQETSVNFKDSNGVYNFPDGYFNGVVGSSDPTVSVDEYGGYIYGQGEVVFNYRIDENIEITEATVKQGVDRYGSSYSEAMEVYAYNYKTDSYDKLTMGQGYEALKDVSTYVENNTIKIKCKVDDSTGKGQGLKPIISIKGRER